MTLTEISTRLSKKGLKIALNYNHKDGYVVKFVGKFPPKVFFAAKSLDAVFGFLGSYLTGLDA